VNNLDSRKVKLVTYNLIKRLIDNLFDDSRAPHLLQDLLCVVAMSHYFRYQSIVFCVEYIENS
jgi:hypothetical protein